MQAIHTQEELFFPQVCCRVAQPPHGLQQCLGIAETGL
jgi:hypothetical protein